MKKIKLVAIVAIAMVFAVWGCKKENILTPTVVSTSPENSSTDIYRNIVISVTFSLAMDPLSINENSFILKQGETLIEGTVSYSGLTATFLPTNTLTENTVYNASISTEAESYDGVALDNEHKWSFTTSGSAIGLAVIDLGSSINYVILAKSEITNVPTSDITGDLGLSPAATSYITGFALVDATGYATSSQVTGNVYAADMADPTPVNLTTAVNDMITAYNQAAGLPFPDFFELATGNIGGRTLSPGLYKWTNNVIIPTDITISGSSTDVWIFQIAGNLTQSPAVNIILSGGAQAENIFWQVAGEVSIGTTAHFEGIILTQTAAILETGASLNGRIMAQTAVNLDSNTIVNP